MARKTVLYPIKYLLETHDEQYKVALKTLHYVKYLFVQHLTLCAVCL